MWLDIKIMIKSQSDSERGNPYLGYIEQAIGYLDRHG